MKLLLLCATTHQHDFSKVEKMRVQSDVIYANQGDCFSYDEFFFDDHRARMFTTPTRGVGLNRNLSLLFAEADICLFTDDDVVYNDGYAQKVLQAFEDLPNADVIIFDLESVHAKNRKPPVITAVKKLGRLSRNPYGGPRIAFRLESIRKANVWFTMLFGGGCRYASGEDSLFLKDCKRKGLAIYTYPYVLAKTDTTCSSWFKGFNEHYFFNKGAYYQATHAKGAFWLWMLYCLLRDGPKSKLKTKQIICWMKRGARAYQMDLSYDEWSARPGVME